MTTPFAPFQGESRIQFEYHDGNQKQILDDFVISATWSGDIMQAARKLEVTLNATINGNEQLIKVGNGREVRFYNNSEELFRGVIFSCELTSQGSLRIVAYDENIYLTKNTDNRIFRNMTASAIARKICTEYQIAMGYIEETGFVIPKLIFREKTIYEMLITALTVTTQQTGRRFFIYASGGKLNVVERKKQMVRWVIERGTNLLDATHALSIEEMRNVINIYGGSDEQPIVAATRNEALIKKFGLMKHVEQADGNMTKSQLDQRAKQRLAELGREKSESSVTVLGINEVFAGRAAYIRDSMTGLINGYYIITDSHTFENGTHTMSLGISLTDELPRIDYVPPSEASDGSKGYSGGKAVVSEQVRKYEDTIHKYAEMYGVESYVELLLAKMMQESGGKGGDPMQSSESMGKPRNSIKDPELSIKQGVKYFSEVLKKANGDVLLALQSYNFGSGFIDYAKKYGGYSTEVVNSYSNMMAKKLGWNRYGDKNYVNNVLRYYVPGSTKKSGVAGESAAVQKVIDIAKKFVGQTKYVFGGGRKASEREKGIFDCSSWLKHVFSLVGYDIGGSWSSVSTDTFVKEGLPVSLKDIKPGDLVFANTYKKNGHILIYLGNGQVIGCGSSGTKINSLSYWKSTYGIGAVRRAL